MDAVELSRTVFAAVASLANVTTVPIVIPAVRPRVLPTPRDLLALATVVALVATAGVGIVRGTTNGKPAD